MHSSDNTRIWAGYETYNHAAASFHPTGWAAFYLQRLYIGQGAFLL